LVLREYVRGMSPDAIFRNADVPVHLFRPRYARERIKAWRAIAKQHGMEHFDTEQRGKNGVALAQWRDLEKSYAAMSDKEKVAFLEAEVEALKEIRHRFLTPPPSHQESHSSRRRTNASSLDV